MDIQVNASEWNGITNDMRERIQSIIGSNFPEATVVGAEDVDTAEKLLAVRTIEKFDLQTSDCTALCDAAEAAAVTACALLGPGIPQALCIVAARAAGKFCRSKC